MVFVEREELEEDSANTWKEWMVFEEQCAVCRLVVMVVFVSMYSCCFLCWNTSRPKKADCVLPGPQSAMGNLFQEHYPRASDESYLCKVKACC